MTLSLDSIKYSVNEHRRKRNVPRSPEDIFMLSQMAPACHSRHIMNDYVLNVNIKFDGCTCCSALPNISCPLTVIPLTDMRQYGFVEPAGYAPFELGYFKFDLTYY